MKAITNQIQPCKLPEAVPPKKAPILQPKLSLAPIPIRIPPIAADNNSILEGQLLLLNKPLIEAKNPAPIIIPIFIKLLISDKTEC